MEEKKKKNLRRLLPLIAAIGRRWNATWDRNWNRKQKNTIVELQACRLQKKKKKKKREKGRFTSGTGRKECWCLVGLVSRLYGMVDVVNSISTTTLEHGGF